MKTTSLPRRPIRPRTIVPASLVLLMLSALSLRAGPADISDRMFVLTVDQTKQGEKVPTPTPENPSYYYPVFQGYKELGDVLRHYERPPASDREIRQALMTALATQGYLPTSSEHPPSLVLVFEWGTIAPVRIGTGKRSRYIANESEIRAYVLGDSSRDVVHGFGGYKQEMSSLEARHFLLISAFAYQTSAQPKGEILLWRAHATTDVWGNYLDEVLSQLIATATPGLGRKVSPGAIWSAKIPHVTIGKPEIKDFPAAPPSSH